MLAYLAILLPVLVLCCGLAVDVGMLEMRKLQMQSASDAAAHGAELEIERGTGRWLQAAQGDAAVNGFTNGSNNTTVTAVMQPATGAFSGFHDAVQVSISQQVPTLFLSLLGTNATTVKTQSVAVVPPCVFVTGAAALTSYSFASTAGTFTSTCPYHVGGGGKLDSRSTLSAMAENITGGSASSAWSGSSAVAPRYNAKTFVDPLRSVAQPALSGCQVTGGSIQNTSAVAYPGTYCGGFNIQNSTITLYPGLYVITGGLNISGSTLNGSGVTFFFTQGGGSSYGQLSFTSSTLNISAPTSNASGGVPGVLFFTDRSWTHTAAQDIILNATTVTGDGIWYLTGTGLSLTNNSQISGPNFVAVDADNLVISSSTLRTGSNYSNVTGGNPFNLMGGLVE